jgi:hypothetical protein
VPATPRIDLLAANPPLSRSTCLQRETRLQRAGASLAQRVGIDVIRADSSECIWLDVDHLEKRTIDRAE